MENVMNIKTYEYYGYLIEIHENPIYHDYQFVIKTVDGKEIIGINKQLYENETDAEDAAKILINDL